MDKDYSAKTPMVIRTLEKDTDPFKLKEEGEKVLRPEYPYLSVISVLMYLTNNIRSGIAFIVNCLARHNVTHTMCHWNNIKNILQYLVATIDLGLFFQKTQESKLIGYTDVDYLL
jgi:hypothetical protein